MRQSICLVINPITVDNFAALQLHAGGSGVRLYDGPGLKLFISVGNGAFVCCLVHRGSTDALLLLQISVGVFLADQGSPYVTRHVVFLYLLSPRLCFFLVFIVLKRDLRNNFTLL